MTGRDLGTLQTYFRLMYLNGSAQAHHTALDWPAVLEAAWETAETLRVEDRLSLLPGNLHEVELPAQSFDLAVVANVTHLLTADQNTSLVGRLHEALRPANC